MGSTNKDSLITALINKTGYTKKLYVADALVSTDLYKRKELFSRQFSIVRNISNEDFTTTYINESGMIKYIGNAIYISKRKLKQLIKTRKKV